ncbi:hypothetical protein Tco_0578668 [Tanacetum coccineum]
MRLSLLKKINDLKKRLAKNNEAKMVIYNALPRKEYERIFMCSTTKEIWKTLLITHQGNSQVKENKIDLLVQQYKQFVISEDEYIDSAFARFNTIVTGLKALDEGYSSKNYIRKFLRALHPKWRAKVMAIEELKDLTSLSLNELIENLKDKKESSDEQSLTFKTKDEEYAMAVRDFKKFFTRRGRDPNHLIGECPKPPKDKNQRAFVEGSWSDSGEEDDELKIKRASRLKHIASCVFKNFVGMKRGFLSQKGSGVGRGMKEKQVLLADKSVEGSKHVNVVNARLESFPTISRAHGIQSSISNKENMNDVGTMVGPTFAGNTPGGKQGKRVAYPVVANYVRNTWVKYGLWNPNVNLLKEDVVNVLVWVKLHGVPVTAFGEDGLSAIATKLELIEVPVDVELKDNIVMVMPKLIGEGFYTCTVRVNTSGNKNKDAEPTKEVSKSNSFDVLNSVESDVELGKNDRTLNLTNKKANSSGSSFWNVESSSTSTTPIVEKIDKMERLIIDRTKDSEIVKAKGERKSLALKAKKQSINEESLTSGSEDKEYAMAVKDFKKFFNRRDAETLIILSENVRNHRERRTKGHLLEVLRAIAVKKMMKRLNMKLVSWLKHLASKCKVIFTEHDSEITKDGNVIGRGIRRRGLYVMKLGNNPKDKICLATPDENSSLWH